MNTKNLSILLTTILLLSSYTGFSNADEEVVLCLNSVDQYVITVNEREDCLEDETPTTFRGRRMAELKSLTPVAVFDNNDKCDTAGSITKLGFDKNGNNKLDEEEIISINQTCALSEDEGSVE